MIASTIVFVRVLLIIGLLSPTFFRLHCLHLSCWSCLLFVTGDLAPVSPQYSSMPIQNNLLSSRELYGSVCSLPFSLRLQLPKSV
jgi:hypothetical protein